MKETLEQKKARIAKETPLSITSTDNPIVEINEKGNGVSVLWTNSIDTPPSAGALVTLKKGERYRFINKGCKIGDHFSALRLMESDAIWVPNECFDLIFGIVIGINTPEEVDHEMN